MANTCRLTGGKIDIANWKICRHTGQNVTFALGVSQTQVRMDKLGYYESRPRENQFNRQIEINR